MSDHRPVDDLTAGYEALRAQAVGDLSSQSPRGLALLVSQGLPVWVRAWSAPAPVNPPSPSGLREPASGVGTEVVALLTEMALGHRTTLASVS